MFNDTSNTVEKNCLTCTTPSAIGSVRCLFEGQIITHKSLEEYRTNARTSVWLDNSANSVIKGARDPDGRLPGSGIGSMLEARWHSVAGPLLLPRENFVRGGWDGMDRVCKHLRFHDTGLATNLKEAYAAAHVKSAL